MRLLFLLLGLAALAPLAFAQAPAEATDSTLRVLSFNLRLNTPSDGPDAWPYRRDTVAAIIRDRADLVGVQEAQRSMLDDLEARLPGFAWFGEPRSDGGPADEYSAIGYRTDRFELLERGTFWLSETPEERASVGWDAALPRIATWGRLRDRRTGHVLYHFNTHFDHRGERARAESARLLRRRIERLAGGAPVVLTGDFNAVPASAPYRHLTTGCDLPGAPLRDGFVVAARGHDGPASTWSGFERVEPGRRIDYVFVGGPLRVVEHRILDETFDGGRFPSDHLPVQAVLRFTPSASTS